MKRITLFCILCFSAIVCGQDSDSIRMRMDGTKLFLDVLSINKWSVIYSTDLSSWYYLTDWTQGPSTNILSHELNIKDSRQMFFKLIKYP
jgi:hypothetical protein